MQLCYKAPVKGLPGCAPKFFNSNLVDGYWKNFCCICMETVFYSFRTKLMSMQQCYNKKFTMFFISTWMSFRCIFEGINIGRVSQLWKTDLRSQNDLIFLSGSIQQGKWITLLCLSAANVSLNIKIKQSILLLRCVPAT